MWQKLIVHTLFPQEFKKFVLDGVRKSELVHIKKKNYEIEISPEFSAMFKESECFSSMLLIEYKYLGENGRFSKLLWKSRKRKHYQIEKDEIDMKDYEEAKEQLDSKVSIINSLKSIVEYFEIERIKMLEDQEKLAKLYEMGLIDDHGDPVPSFIRESDDMN